MSWRRPATIGVLIAVAAVGAAAVVDAVRPDSGEASKARADTTTDPEPDPVRAALKAEEVGGILYYSHPEDDCRVHAVSLPDLEQVAPPKLRACRFELPSEPGTGALEADAAWQPGGGYAASCADGWISVSTQAGYGVGGIEGCAPAWKPDGTLTVTRAGEVWGTPCPGPDAYGRPACWRKLLSTVDLRRAARTLQIVPPDPRYLRSATAFEAAWLTDSRAAVLVRVQLKGRLRGIGPITALALFEGRRLVSAVPYSGAGLLRLSPRRTFLAVVESGGRVAVVDADGRTRLDSITIPAPNAAAVAWSPDERWTAIASRWSVYLLPTADIVAGRTPRSIRLPLAARDLAWR
ncbi:MAG TPA: hypothetical protein VD769_03830 [Gaiellaceae bacterium]|nr:hypothetical protein [Gaiellaceae bacterium]